jgi:hypothetical protein
MKVELKDFEKADQRVVPKVGNWVELMADGTAGQ